MKLTKATCDYLIGKIYEDMDTPKYLELDQILCDASKLFDGDMHKVYDWFFSPSHIFFDTTPFDMVIGGRGSVVINWQKELLGG